MPATSSRFGPCTDDVKVVGFPALHFTLLQLDFLYTLLAENRIYQG